MLSIDLRRGLQKDVRRLLSLGFINMGIMGIGCASSGVLQLIFFHSCIP